MQTSHELAKKLLSRRDNDIIIYLEGIGTCSIGKLVYAETLDRLELTINSDEVCLLGFCVPSEEDSTLCIHGDNISDIKWIIGSHKTTPNEE